MKRLFIIAFVTIYLIACNKEKNQAEIVYPEFIITGETTGLGIKYSGVINDTLFFDYPSSSLNRFIDMNDDGINDFELRFSGTASPGHQNSKNSIVALGESFLVVPVHEKEIADTISVNGKIDKDLNWVNDTCTLYNYYWDASGASSSSGLWNNVKNKYIGTKILVEDKTLFGWIRLEITNGWNLTHIDHAITIGYEQE